MTTTQAKRQRFRRLHEAGCFILPNPWDIGTTRYLQHLGFEALATTSSGAAFSIGLPDMDWAVPRDVMLAHIRTLVEATDLPVNADYESGYAHDPQGVAESVRLCVATGVAGLSIEDATGNRAQPLYELAHAVERIVAAREAASNSGIVLTARAENFLVGQTNLDAAIRRLLAYAEAGADCLYAPGIRTHEQISAVVEAVSPKPVNLLIGAATGVTLRDAAALGVRRISVGSGLARTAWGAFMRAAKDIRDNGRFDSFADAVPFAEINAFFRTDLQARNRAGS
jgi:2-methylisocitrate lyase-like PEP mutase family enzyme